TRRSSDLGSPSAWLPERVDHLLPRRGNFGNGTTPGLQGGAHGDLAELRQLARGQDGGGPHPDPREPEAVGHGAAEQHRQRDRRGNVDGQVAEDYHGNGGYRDAREGAEDGADRVRSVSLSLLRQRGPASLFSWEVHATPRT